MSGEGVRQRKGKAAASGSPKAKGSATSKAKTHEEQSSSESAAWWASAVLGTLAVLYAAQWFTVYVGTLHENHLWFTNIKEVEREISLRTECGLYYSYYKEVVRAPSFGEGIRRLLHDNKTEHGRTINILHRFNVYQEVALAWLWRTVGSSWEPQPMLFYVWACFTLTGLGVGVLAAMAWGLTGTPTAAILAAVYFTVNLDDATRVFFTVNLREIFAFPFLWAQIASVCVFLRRRDGQSDRATKESLLLVSMYVFGTLFAVTWQFNQFVFLIQACSMIGVGVLELAPQWKVRWVLGSEAAALLSVWLLQFAHPMLLGSLVLSLIPCACLVMWACAGLSRWSRGLIWGVVAILLQLVATAALTVLLNLSIKAALGMEDDAHIFKFLLGKFGLGEPRDFDSKVYLCHGAFQFLDNGFWWRTTKTALLPAYLLLLGGVLMVMGRDLLVEWSETSPKGAVPPADASDKPALFNRRPDFAFLAIESVVSGLMGMMALRMKYLWTPHIVLLATMLWADPDPIHALLNSLQIKGKRVGTVLTWVLPLIVSAALIGVWLPTYRQQMDDLKEFWDPDTVELMEWAKNNTAEDASFAGSMQLLAGVKLSTDRHLTNHPHYEDKWLRERTKRIYQMYGRTEPRRVWELLRAEDTNYIILEDSICLAPSDGCRTPDLVDLENGHLPDSGSTLPGLVKSSTPRFCDEIRHGTTAFSRLFSLVLQNKTFRVYQLIDPPQKGAKS